MKSVAFCFGRYNPPHKGHEQLFRRVMEHDNGIIFASQTHDPKRNPLPFTRKMYYLQEMFPWGNFNQDTSVRTYLEAAKMLSDQGYTDVTFIAGEDDIESMGETLVQYNGKIFNFNSIELQESPRIVAATDLREFAKTGHKDAFLSGLGISDSSDTDSRISTSIGTELYEELRQNLYETVSAKELRRLDAYLDRLYKTVGIDVEFTNHFASRVNDIRSNVPISSEEILKIFRDAYQQYGKPIAQLGPEAQAVLRDLSTDLNVPFKLEWDSRNQELDLIAKTIMRKPNFRTGNQTFEV